MNHRAILALVLATVLGALLALACGDGGDGRQTPAMPVEERTTPQPRATRVVPTATPIPTPTATPEPTQEALQCAPVRSGDGWSIIAKRHNVSMNDLLEANSATVSTVIHAGQCLTLPAGTTTGITPSTPTPDPVVNRAACEREKGKYQAGRCIPLTEWCSETDTRALRKTPDDVDGCFALRVDIFQFDARTGPCLFLARDADWNQYVFGTETWADMSALMAAAGAECSVNLDTFFEDQSVTIYAEAREAWSYDTAIGGRNTLPYLQIIAIEHR